MLQCVHGNYDLLAIKPEEHVQSALIFIGKIYSIEIIALNSWIYYDIIKVIILL